MPENYDPQHPRPDDAPGSTPEHEGRITSGSNEPDANLDPYAKEDGLATDTMLVPAEPTPVAAPVKPPPPPTPPPANEEPDEEEDGMLRMSFLDHLEELRFRIIRALMGLGVGFFACIYFADDIWNGVRAPAAEALQQLGYPPELAQITPTEAFSVIWVRLPLLASLFVAAPWVLYQVWSFIAPGLYKKERKLAVPFIFTTAGLFILGGAFAYFIAFRFGLVFLLGIGSTMGVRPMISITEYTDLFINVILGVSLVFELPVLIFFLTLLRVLSPRFLLRHSRYAILLIVIAAAIITPTPDVVNLTIFAAPMVVLYFAGVFASYLLVLSREGGKFPWAKVLYGALAVIIAIALFLWLATAKYGYHWVWKWPLLVK